MDLDVILPLRRASIYQNAKDPTRILPKVFGNYLDTNAVPTDPDDGGFTPCPCVDRLNLIYLVNDGRAVSSQPQIFYNGKLQENSVAAWNPANNLEGQGIVATLQFRLQEVLKGEVSVRFGGSTDGSGVAITNPIVGLFTVLTQYAGWTLADFDRGTCERSMFDMNALGYPFYWTFAEEKTIREWLLEILPHYLTDFTETGQNQLAIMLDRSLTTFTMTQDYHIPAYEIEDFGSPATALSIEAQADDVANQITLHGRHNWVTGESTESYTWNYVHSQSAYRAAYPAEFTFRGMYTLTHASQWLNSFAMRHGFEPRTVSFTMKGLKGIPLIPPRFVTVEWPLLGWVQHLLKIRKTSISLNGRRIRLECIDCGRELSDAITSPLASPTQRRQQLSRLYTYVPGTIGDTGDLLTAPSDPRNEAANGDFELGDTGQWDLTGGAATAQWTIVENATEAYHGRFYARHVLGAGNGRALDLRHRVDPGEWVVVSAWFRQHGVFADGQPWAILAFSDINDAPLPFMEVWGNPIDPTSTYLESVAFGQAPISAYYYRPGIGFRFTATVGQWRADQVFAASGSLNEVLTARQGALVSRNFVVNGDFESGPLLWNRGRNWLITNNPGATPYSGVWYAAHEAESIGLGEDRLSSLTKIAVTPGQTFTFQVYTKTLNNPTGTGRLGVTWIDGQENAIGENATSASPGPIPTWTLASGAMTVPAGASYAHTWIGITNHIGGTTTFWLIDDAFVYS